MPRTKTFDESEKLENALNLFWKKGFNATSMQDLVDAMEINRSSIYDTYQNKENLFRKAIEHYSESNAVFIKNHLGNDSPVRDKFRSLFSHAINQAIKDPERKGCFMVNTTTELANVDSHIHAIMQDSKNELVDLFKTALERGQAEGEIMRSKDVDSLALLFFTIYNGIQVITKLDQNQDSIINSVELTLNLLD